MELKQIIELKGDQISSTLLDQLRDVQIDGKYTSVLALLKTIQIIQEIGWVEHTCDWDLNTIITTKDGETYETGHGYADSLNITKGGMIYTDNGSLIAKYPNFKDYPLSHEAEGLELSLPEEETDDDIQSFSILIKDIRSISIYR